MENSENTNKYFKNIQRLTAYKVWISDLFNGVFVKGQQEFEASYVATRGLNISRVNLVGAVIAVNNQEGFASIVIDDGSGNVALRVWREDVLKLIGFNVGDIVLSVGKVRSFNNSIYVVPDFVRKLDNNAWIRVRRLELEKRFGKSIKMENSNPAPVVDEYIPSQDFETDDISFATIKEENVSNSGQAVVGEGRANITSIIESEDKGEGADIALVIAKSGVNENEAQKIIDELIRGGEVFEIRPGFVRVMG